MDKKISDIVSKIIQKTIWNKDSVCDLEKIQYEATQELMEAINE